MTDTAKFHIFIGHSSVDGVEHAERLHAALTSSGISAWVDRKNLNPYNDFTGQIDKEITRASHVVICVTPDILREDSYVRAEISFAKAIRKKIIPVRFANVPPPTPIVNNTWINFHEKSWDAAYSELLERLRQPDDFDTVEAESDPFRPYLEMLRDEIERYLDFAIIREIPLQSIDTPDAVETKQAATILGTFFGAVIGAKEHEKQSAVSFDNFGDAYRRYGGRVLLLGDPGAGKTITLMTFARIAVSNRLSDPAQPLPILARISEWNAAEQTPLADWLAKTIPMISRNEFSRVLEGGSALLMLDGLDELGSTAQIITKDTELEFLSARRVDPRNLFLKLLPKKGRLVLSCRIKDFNEIHQKVALDGAITLLQLNDTQIQDYLYAEPDLWEVLKSDNVLRDVARTPLLLSIFTYGFAGLDEEAKKLRTLARGDIRDRIFETYVNRRYEHEIRKRQLPYSLETMMNRLGTSAMENAAGWTWQANIIDVSHFADQFGNNYTAFIEQTRLLHLFMTLGKSHYRFVHLLLRDYFAFRAALVALALPTGNNHLQAVGALRQLGDPRGLDALIGALSDPDEDVKQVAIIALAELGDTRAGEPLIRLLHDPSEDVSILALQALVELHEMRGVEPIIKIINKKSYTKKWFVALDALGKLGGENAVQKLLALVQNRKIPRTALIAALVDTGDKRAINPLRTMAEANPDLRTAIAAAINSINAKPHKRRNHSV